MCEIEPDMVREVVLENEALRQENEELKAEVDRAVDINIECDEKRHALSKRAEKAEAERDNYKEGLQVIVDQEEALSSVDYIEPATIARAHLKFLNHKEE